MQGARAYGSESGGDSRPTSAGEGAGGVKKVPVKKAQRMWEALNGGAKASASASGRSSSSVVDGDERVRTEKGADSMGVEMMLNKGKEREIVDLSSESSEGGSFDSR